MVHQGKYAAALALGIVSCGVADGQQADVPAPTVIVYFSGPGRPPRSVLYRFTGNETVNDVLREALGGKGRRWEVWLLRKDRVGKRSRLDVDWDGIVVRGESRTNYQLFPSDEVYVRTVPRGKQ